MVKILILLLGPGTIFLFPQPNVPLLVLITTSRQFEVCTPNFGVIKYSYIQAIVLPYLKQLLRTQHVSEDHKRLKYFVKNLKP